MIPISNIIKDNEIPKFKPLYFKETLKKSNSILIK